MAQARKPIPIRLGTRGSKLALWQAEHVAARLTALGAEPALEIIKTSGDLDQVTDFGAMGAKGIFVKEIEAALLENRIDIAVHSLKDLPTDLPEGLALACVLEREDPSDALVSRDGLGLAQLPEGATVATGSQRRAAQVLAFRPDLVIGPMRGNVPTRIRKIREGYADATVIALAGVRRLGFEDELSEIFSPQVITPSMGQGAVAIEARTGELAEILSGLEHPQTRIAVEAERAFIARVGGGCNTPVGVLATPQDGNRWSLRVMLASPDGTSILREVRSGIEQENLNDVARALAAETLGLADEKILSTFSGAPAHPGDASA